MGSVLIQLIFTLLVVGLLLWAIQAIPWIDGTIKQIIKIIVIVVAGLWLISILYTMFTTNNPGAFPLFPRR